MDVLDYFQGSVSSSGGGLPWATKYCPKSWGEYIGNWGFDSNPWDIWSKKPRAVFVWGGSGFGKSTMVSLMLPSDMKRVDVTMNDLRTKQRVKHLIETSVETQNVTGGQKVLVIHDAEVALSGDQGGLSELQRYIFPWKGCRKIVDRENKKASMIQCPPVIFLSLKKPSSKLLELANESIVIRLYPPSPDKIRSLITRIWKSENLGRINNTHISDLVEQSGSDIRNAINSLEMGKGTSLKFAKNQQIDKDEFLSRIFRGNSSLDELIRGYMKTGSRICESIHENVHSFLAPEAPISTEVLDALCDSDLFESAAWPYGEFVSGGELPLLATHACLSDVVSIRTRCPKFATSLISTRMSSTICKRNTFASLVRDMAAHSGITRKVTDLPLISKLCQQKLLEKEITNSVIFIRNICPFKSWEKLVGIHPGFNLKPYRAPMKKEWSRIFSSDIE